MIVGDHWIAEFLECNPKKIGKVGQLKDAFLGAAKKGKATALAHKFHQFEPHGVSGLIFIAESHISIHTWPEYNLACVDIFTCGKEMDPKVVLESLEKDLEAKEVKYKKLERGF